ncbi:METTL5 family protein [Sulfurisphaera javensis]|uniref:Methyltransferase-like protein 5 n=1 Tax=Sulfurisphaera javensis TaxID=2049879 RepID=A0AAT9GNR2_9CREN
MEKIPLHPNPNYELEQYLTPSDLASEIIWTAFLRGDVKNKVVVDLGCGTGRLCAGISLLGGYCICVDIDYESLKVAKEFFENENIIAEFVNADVNNLEIRADTVIQNPPFGVVRKGADLIFLDKALSIAKTVYSIHKSNPETLQLITKLATSKGFQVEYLTHKFRMKAYYPWHRKKIHEFLIDIYLFTKPFNRQ